MTELLLINGYTPSMVEACQRLEAYRVANLEEQARRLSRSKAGRAGRGGRP